MKFEMESLRRNLLAMDHQMHEKFDTLQRSHDEAINKIYMKFANNPLDSRVDSLENRCKNFITSERFNAMQGQLLEFASLPAFDHLADRVKHLDEIFVTKVGLELTMSDFTTTMEEKLAERVSQSELQEQLDSYDQDVSDRLNRLQRIVDGVRKTYKQLQNDF